MCGDGSASWLHDHGSCSFPQTFAWKGYEVSQEWGFWGKFRGRCSSPHGQQGWDCGGNVDKQVQSR